MLMKNQNRKSFLANPLRPFATFAVKKNYRQDAKSAKKLFVPIYCILLFCTAGILLAQQPQMIPQPRQQMPKVVQNPTDGDSLALTLTQPPAKLEQALRQVCGHRLVTDAQYQYTFTSNRNNTRRQSSLRIEAQTNRATLSGDKQLCEQIFQLLTAIDQPAMHGKGRRIVPYQYTPPELLAQVFDAYKVQPPRNEIVISPLNPAQPIQQVRYQFPEGGLLDGGGMNPVVPIPRNDMPGFLLPTDPTAINVIDDFRIRILQDIDVILMEGDGARLNQFVEMIQKLEELSKLNRPKIEVIYLKHVNNVSLGAIFRQQEPALIQGQMPGSIYNDVFRTVQGAVRILPMTSPNAMMLLGWGDAMETAKELITALDQPTATEHSRLHIVKLKHISANQARQVLAGAFPPNVPANSGFLARIQLYADPRSNVLIVQAAPNELEEAKRILNDIDVPSAAPKLQVETVKLKHSLAPDLAQTLSDAILTGTAGTPDGKFPAFELLIRGKEGQRLIESGIMSDVSISTDVRQNQIIIKAPDSCMTFIKELVALLDIAGPEAEIKIFQIEHGDASSMVGMLTSLFPAPEDGSPGPQLPGSANEETLIPPRFAVDQRSNSIVAAGAPGDLKVIEALVYSLDREDQLSRKLEVYCLKNQKALPVAETIMNYVNNRLQVQEASVASGVISNYQHLESAVTVTPDEASNSLIISATEKYYDEIMDLIKKIDKSPPQVVVKVLIVEVTLSEDKEWAAELGLQDPLMFAKRGGNLLFNSGNGSNSLGSGSGAPGTVGSQILSNFGAGRVGEGGYGGLVFSASSDYLNIMLRALHEKKRLEVLSNPQITTMNNQIATISVGQKVPRSRGGTMNQQGVMDYKVEDVDVALELGITPTISPEGTIVMIVVLRKEKIGTEVSVGEDRIATIDSANLNTMISAANNQTVVLGGLITKDENKTRRKIPLLGDVPVLGKMFRQELDSTIRKELLVILTPRIIESQEDLEQVKQMEFARMSWCLNNVVDVYGDIGAYNVVSERPYIGNAPVISPGPVKMEDLEPLLAPTLPTPVLPKRE